MQEVNMTHSKESLLQLGKWPTPSKTCVSAVKRLLYTNCGVFLNIIVCNVTHLQIK